MTTISELLLVVDVQNGFVSEDTRSVVLKIKRLIESGRFKNFAFTQFLNADGSPYEQYLHWFRLKSVEEQSIADELLSHAKTVFRKTIYSAMTDEFEEYLRDNDYKTIYIAGIDTDCCVLASSISIFEMGLRPIVLAEYCASNGGIASHKAGLLALERLIGTEQIIREQEF